MATQERVISPQVAEDGSVHYPSVTSVSDDSVAVCHMRPDRVIPIIFVPGVMGSNLMDAESKRSVWVVNSGAGMSGWLKRGPSDRKVLLDPAKTAVFDGGDLPPGTSLTYSEKRARGWGTVSKKSYGDWLVWLQDALDDCTAGNDYGRKGLRMGLTREPINGINLSLRPLSSSDVALSYRYDYPVHAVGYNWLQSNADSAKHLGREIDRIMTLYRQRGRRCERVIVVTHSMGGLVARHCSEIQGYRDKILGIVSGVMPATGSATAYKRVKAGWESDGTVIGWGVRKVLGENADEITAVFGQSPGPLQLLPDPDYGMGWLQIQIAEGQYVRLPQGGNPYSEIYTQRGKWWGLIDDKLLNPLDKNKREIEQDWKQFNSLIDGKVKTFHMDVSRRYHPYTYAFYGDDAKHKTFGDVVWARKTKPGPRDIALKPIDAPLDLSVFHDDRVGTQILTNTPKLLAPANREEFSLREASENGDGTVPVRSGRAPAQYAKACLAFPDVDHEGAYEPLYCRHFALWAVTRIVGNVKGTPMEYSQ